MIVCRFGEYMAYARQHLESVQPVLWRCFSLEWVQTQIPRPAAVD